MKIQINAWNYFKEYFPEEATFMDISEKTNIGQFINDLNIPKDKIGFVIVNNVKVSDDYILKENDIVSIYPTIIGG